MSRLDHGSRYRFVHVVDRSEGPLQLHSGRRRLLDIASNLGGALGGAAVGIIGGPLAGVATGVATSEALRELAAYMEPTASEVLSGPLGPREQERVVAALGFAIRRIEERIQTGETIREDGFFDDLEGHRPDSHQLLEGVLRESAGSYEEHRVRHLGCLYASFVFDRDRPGDAFYLLDTAKRLTYRQLVILAIFTEEGDLIPNWQGNTALDEIEPMLFAEITHLGRNRLITTRGRKPITGINDVNPSDAVASALGNRLYTAMELKTVSHTDREAVKQAFWRLGDQAGDREV